MPKNDERVWVVDADETGEVNPDELANAMLEIAGMLRRLGGAVTMSARRVQVDGQGLLYLTEQVTIGWKLHLPLSRRRRPDPVEAPVEPLAELDGDEPELAEAVTG